MSKETPPTDGFISIKLPADTYNMSIFYQGFERKTHFNDTETWEDMYENKTRVLANTITLELWVDISDILTDLTLNDTDFVKFEWDASRPAIDTSQIPNRIFMYYNDTVEISVLFEDIQTGGYILIQNHPG